LTFQAMMVGPRGGATVLPLGLTIAELEAVCAQVKMLAAPRRPGRA
jgi:hypothetical protein